MAHWPKYLRDTRHGALLTWTCPKCGNVFTGLDVPNDQKCRGEVPKYGLNVNSVTFRLGESRG